MNKNNVTSEPVVRTVILNANDMRDGQIAVDSFGRHWIKTSLSLCGVVCLEDGASWQEASANAPENLRLLEHHKITIIVK